MQINKYKRLSRQAAMVHPSIADMSVLVIGGGGIGSNAIHVLACMGVEDITVVDSDSVGEENIYPGWFGSEDVGVQKTHAIANECRAKYGIEIQYIDGRVGDEATDLALEQVVPDVVLVCTDSLRSRLLSWHLLKDTCNYWIDARMGGTGFDLYAFSLNEASEDLLLKYEATLSRNEGFLACGEKATAFLTKGYIAGKIGETMRDVVNNIPIPYHCRYDAGDKIFLMEDENGKSWSPLLVKGGEQHRQQEEDKTE